jgi:pimeloyl-[acyl-carrier protein] methyl ester esterase
VKPFTLETIVAAVAQRFGAQDAAPTVLGWSFGATVAMAWAARGGVARLVLVGATPRFVAAPDWPYAMAAATLARFHDELRVAYRDTLNRFLALQTHGSEHGRAALHALRAHLFVRGEPDAAVLQSGLDVLARADLRDTVREIAAPALVVVGGRDTLTPPQAGEWLARALPNARLARIEGAAHAPFLSHPREFAAALDRFTGG